MSPPARAFNGNPSFCGGYAEVGYFLTGETRAYKGGKLDRTKVLKPFNDGGWGAFQVNGRIDTSTSTIASTSSATFVAPFYVNGGKQIGYQVSVIWNPMDYLRFMAQFGHVNVTGGPRPQCAVPNLTSRSTSASIGVETAAVRSDSSNSKPFGSTLPLLERRPLVRRARGSSTRIWMASIARYATD